MSSWFSNGMNKVVAVMVHWNKVSLTLPTSTPTYNTTKKVFVRASVAQISYLCVWIKRSSELAHGAVNSTSFSSCYAAWPSFSKLWTDGEGLQALATGVMPQPMYLQWLLDSVLLVMSGYCGLQSMVCQRRLQVPLSLTVDAVHFLTSSGQHTIEWTSRVVCFWCNFIF